MSEPVRCEGAEVRVGGPWHRRRLRVSPGCSRASEPARMRARMRAHLLALGAWMAAGNLAAVWRSAAVMSPGEAAECRSRLRRAVACDAGWAAAARRWA